MATVGFLLANGFEESEFRIPFERVRARGHVGVTLGVSAGELVRGKRGKVAVAIDAAVADRRPEDFHALVIPGGHSPERLRADPRVVSFVKAFIATGRPVAAICHGPELLLAAGAVRGRKLTSWPSIRGELEAGGAEWLDAAVVIDGPLITSRKPADVDEFAGALTRALT